MHLIKFGTVDLIDHNAEDETGFEFRDGVTELLSGGIDLLGSYAYPGTRTIRRRCSLIATDDHTIEYNYQQLVTALGRGRSVMRAQDREGTEYVTLAKLVDLGRMAQVDRYNCEQPLVLRWRQDYPYWIHAEDIQFAGAGYTAGMGVIAAPQTVTGTFTSMPDSLTITATGTAPRTKYGHLTLTPQGSAYIGEFTIHNRANGHLLRYIGTVNDGERLVIDFQHDTARLDGGSVYNNVYIPDDAQVDWMLLELGTNEIEFEANVYNGSVDYSWAWARHYL